MSSSLLLAVWFGVAALLALAVAARARRARTRRREGVAIARELGPEIRALMKACDPSASEELRLEPMVAKHFERHRQKLAGVVPKETLFAVETFYQCFEAHGDAALTMGEAFAPGNTWSLGDRIRAKDRRDRTLKDLYYTGAAALEKLGALTGESP